MNTPPSASGLGNALKAATGVTGLDEITCGGLPRGRTTVFFGGPGCGKTVLALETLVRGARDFGEPGMFVAFEESADQIVAHAESFGWDLKRLRKADLFFLEARLSPDIVSSGTFDLTALLSSLEAKAREMGAKRVVLDGIDVLLELLPARRDVERELFRLRDWLDDTGLTGIITAKAATEGEASSDGSGPSRIHFLADCVVELRRRLVDHINVRDLRVVKFRGSAFHENAHPFVISSRGMEVAGPDSATSDFIVSDERLTTGVVRLDSMLDGGYFRGSSVLITGAPGTAKTSLASAFAQAACNAGQATLYVALDEDWGEVVRNMRSIGIELGPHVAAGTLKMHSAMSSLQSAEGHFVELRRLVEEFRPSALIIDPISAMLQSGSPVAALRMAERLIRMAKGQGMTTFLTSLVEGHEPEGRSRLPISTIADTWMHLTYEVHAGERNRTISIVKSRGTGHSNQVRELLLSDRGIDVSDVYTVGGEVLMGTLRWEREREEELVRQTRREEAERRRSDIESSLARSEAQMRALQVETARLEAELGRLETEPEMDQRWREREHGVATRRRSDWAEDNGGGAPC